MDVFVFFLIVGLILLMGVLVSVRLNDPDSMMRGRIRHIRRLRRVRAVPGMVGVVPTVSGVASAVPVDTVIEEIIDEVEPEPEEEEV